MQIFLSLEKSLQSETLLAPYILCKGPRACLGCDSMAPTSLSQRPPRGVVPQTPVLLTAAPRPSAPSIPGHVCPPTHHPAQVSTGFQCSNMMSALPSNFLDRLLSTALMEDAEIRLFVLEILISFIDRHGNRHKFSTIR